MSEPNPGYGEGVGSGGVASGPSLKASGKFSGSTILESVGIASTLLLSTGRTRVSWATPYPAGVVNYPITLVQHAGLDANGYCIRISAQTESYIEVYSQFFNPVVINPVNASVSVFAGDV